MDDIWREVIGFAAGAVVTSAALPRILDILRNPGMALNESLPRNAMLAGGNVIWVFYGVLEDAVAVAAMCGLSALFNGAIMASVVLARRGRARRAAT